MQRPSPWLILALLLGGCSLTRSLTDEVHLLFVSGDKEPRRAPASFVVTPQEVIALVPRDKVGFRLYADSRWYYLRQEVDTLGVTRLSKTNSDHARRVGLRVDGTSRQDLEWLRAFRAAHAHATLDMMKAALEADAAGGR